jgi:hypothetical protein
MERGQGKGKTRTEDKNKGTDRDEGQVSQTAKTMVLGALIATAGLWILAMTVAMGYVTFRK